MPTLAPASVQTTVSIAPAANATPAPVSVSIPSADGLSGSIVLPAAVIPANTTLQVTTATTLPSGVAALSAGRRIASVSGATVLYYQGLRFSEDVTFPSYPALTIVLPSLYNTSLGSYQLAFWNGSAWSQPFGAPGTPSGAQVAFAGVSGPVTFAANTTYVFALYYQQNAPAPAPSVTPSASPSPTATPTTAPSATPTTAPTAMPTTAPTATPVPTPSPVPTVGPLSVNPPTLTFNGTGSDLTATVTASSANYTGAYSASTCVSGTTTVATVSGFTNSAFTVTPAAVGSCTIDVSDDLSRHASVTVTVTTSSVTVQSRKR